MRWQLPPLDAIMPEDHCKPSTLPDLNATKLSQQGFEPSRIAGRPLRAGSVAHSQSRGSDGESKSTDDEALQKSKAIAACSSTGEANEACQKKSFWFYLRAPGRFAPWTSKSAKWLHFLRFYNRGGLSQNPLSF